MDHCFPEYDIWTQFVSADYTRALELDALDSSHPIEVNCEGIHVMKLKAAGSCSLFRRMFLLLATVIMITPPGYVVSSLQLSEYTLKIILDVIFLFIYYVCDWLSIKVAFILLKHEF